MSVPFAHFSLDTTPIGTGQSASVYRAVDQSTGNECALKVFSEEAFDDPILAKRFDREVRVLEKLDHPGIVKILGSGTYERSPWIAMTLCESRSLKDSTRDAATVGRKLRGLARVASALDYSHGEGILHRDIKPSNILIDRNQNYFLSDFGIAKLTGDATRITSTGNVLGTAAYMSPEQAQDASLGPASDRYSLGVIAYEAIFGHLPFSANSVPAVMLKHITEPVPIPAGTNPILASILRRALAKDPDQRWRSATDLISSLSEALIDALQSKVGAAEITRVVPTPLHKPRVLLVDDNAEQRSLIETRIKYAGLLAVVARTGPEGLSKLQSGSYDVVIVHTDLEWVTGLDIARRIRDIEQKYGSRAMIVASSARLDDAAKREAMANGIDQLIPRPVDQVFLDTLFKTYRPIRF